MNTLTLNILIGIATATIGILAFVNEFPDKGFFGVLKSITFKLILFIICSIVIICATIQKDSNADRQTLRDKLGAKNEQHRRDLDNRKLTDQSNSKIVNTFTSALAKYGLKYDSSQKAVIKFVRDSAKIINKNNPELNICDIHTDNPKDTIAIHFTFCSQESTAYNVHIVLYSIIENNNSFELISSDKLYNGSQIGINLRSTIEKLYWDKRIMASNNLYFLFTGYFTDSSGKIYKYHEMSMYIASLKKTGMPLKSLTDSLITFAHKKHLNY